MWWPPNLSLYFIYPLIYREDNREGKFSSWGQCHNFTVSIYSVRNSCCKGNQDEPQQIFKTVSSFSEYTFKTPKSFFYPINSQLLFPHGQTELLIPYNYGSTHTSGFSVPLQSLLSHTKQSGCCSQHILCCPFFPQDSVYETWGSPALLNGKSCRPFPLPLLPFDNKGT